MWVSSLIHPIHLLISPSCSVFIHQYVCHSHSSCSLFADPHSCCVCSSVCECHFLFFPFSTCWTLLLSLLTRMWVLPLAYSVHCLLTSLLLCLCLPACESCPLFINACWPLSFCLHLLGCEHLPCLFHLLSADSDFDCSLDRLWVPIIVCPILYLLTSLLFKMWVLLLICAIFCLLPLILCFLTPFFLSPLLRMWVLPTFHFLLADHSPFYPCFLMSECCNFFISFSAC